MKSTSRGLIAILAVIAAAVIWKYFLKTDSSEDKALQRREIATQVLAEFLKDSFPDAEMLIIANPYTQTKGRDPEIYAFDEAGIRGVREGWKGSSEPLVIGYPELKPEAVSDPASIPLPFATSTPLSFLTADNAWDSLVEKHPGVDVIISLIGLPAGLTQTGFWNDRDGPRVAAIFPDLSVIGNSETMQSAFQSGRLVAAVFEKPDASAEESSLMEDARSEFNAHFVLVTKSNYETYLVK